MNVSPDLALAFFADARLPVGGHAQSAGLEPALLAGLTFNQIQQYIQARLETVVVVEAAVAVVARSIYLNTAPGTDRETKLAALDAHWAARTPGAAARGASRQLGRGFLRLAHTLWQGQLADLPRRPSRPLVVGVIAALSGIDAEATVRLVAYDDVQTVCSATMKLCPVDPLEISTWSWKALPDIENVVIKVSALTAPENIPAASAPLLEAWVEAHQFRKERLFSA